MTEQKMLELWKQAGGAVMEVGGHLWLPDMIVLPKFVALVEANYEKENACK